MAVRELANWGPDEVANQIGEFAETLEVDNTPRALRELQASIVRWMMDTLLGRIVSISDGDNFKITPNATLDPVPANALFTFRAHKDGPEAATLKVGDTAALALKWPDGTELAENQLLEDTMVTVRKGGTEYTILHPPKADALLPPGGVAGQYLDGTRTWVNLPEANLQPLVPWPEYPPENLTLTDYRYKTTSDAGGIPGIYVPRNNPRPRNRFRINIGSNSSDTEDGYVDAARDTEIAAGWGSVFSPDAEQSVSTMTWNTVAGQHLTELRLDAARINQYNDDAPGSVTLEVIRDDNGANSQSLVLVRLPNIDNSGQIGYGLAGTAVNVPAGQETISFDLYTVDAEHNKHPVNIRPSKLWHAERSPQAIAQLLSHLTGDERMERKGLRGPTTIEIKAAQPAAGASVGEIYGVQAANAQRPSVWVHGAAYQKAFAERNRVIFTPDGLYYGYGTHGSTQDNFDGRVREVVGNHETGSVPNNTRIVISIDESLNPPANLYVTGFGDVTRHFVRDDTWEEGDRTWRRFNLFMNNGLPILSDNEQTWHFFTDQAATAAFNLKPASADQPGTARELTFDLERFDNHPDRVQLAISPSSGSVGNTYAIAMPKSWILATCFEKVPPADGEWSSRWIDARQLDAIRATDNALGARLSSVQTLDEIKYVLYPFGASE